MTRHRVILFLVGPLPNGFETLKKASACLKVYVYLYLYVHTQVLVCVPMGIKEDHE